MSSTQDQTIVLVTGANQGIGLALVKRLSSNPTYHLLLGSRDISKGEAAVTSISSPSNVTCLQVDISNDTSINKAVDTIQSRFGRIDVLVNNAGIMPDGPTVPAEQKADKRSTLRAGFETNVISAAMMTDAALPLLQMSQAPRIIFMSSGLGSLGMTSDPNAPFYGYDAPAYKSSKAALNMIALTYAAKLQKTENKVDVNIVCPGAVSTGLNHFREGLEPVEAGTDEVFRLITEGKRGETATFTARGEIRPW